MLVQYMAKQCTWAQCTGEQWADVECTGGHGIYEQCTYVLARTSVSVPVHTYSGQEYTGLAYTVWATTGQMFSVNKKEG